MQKSDEKEDGIEQSTKYNTLLILYSKIYNRIYQHTVYSKVYLIGVQLSSQ